MFNNKSVKVEVNKPLPFRKPEIHNCNKCGKVNIELQREEYIDDQWYTHFNGMYVSCTTCGYKICGKDRDHVINLWNHQNPIYNHKGINNEFRNADF